MKKVILGLIILLVAIGVGVGLFIMISDATEPEEMIMVAVAKTDVAEGTFLTSAEYEYKAIPKSQYIASYVTMQTREVSDQDGNIKLETYDSLKGKEVRSPLYQGEMINKSRISFSNEMEDEEEFNNKLYKRYTYNGSGLNNFAGLLKSGDRVDIWLQYTISSTDNEETGEERDRIIVTDKIFSNVLISRVLDETGNEITTSSGGASVLEFMMTEEDIQKFISWRAIGTVTLVKSSTDDADTEITRKVISMNQLISDVVNDKASNSLLDPNGNYIIDSTVNDMTETT